MNEFPNIFIGWDSREDIAFKVLKESILDQSSIPVNIIPIKAGEMRNINFYRRVFHTQNYSSPFSIKIDSTDNLPFSTEFSFTRFLIPFLSYHSGYSLFMDCDMFVRADVAEVFDYVNKEDKAIWCVKHTHVPPNSETVKMDHQIQSSYSRKNWSSFVLWNCSHSQHQNLTIDDVNIKSGWWLHNFKWLEDSDIGSLPESWNWLDGYSPDTLEAKNVHFTRGGPWFKTWEPRQRSDARYGLEWQQLSDALAVEETLGKERKIKWEKTYVR